MNALYHLERACRKARHSKLLEQAAPVWNVLRPVYNRFLGLFATQGLARHINGTDLIRLTPECREVSEMYEPEVWRRVMQAAVPGARIIDVGAQMGLYATAFGKRVGTSGRVLAVEPDPASIAVLRKHIALNGLEGIVAILPAAFSDQRGTAALHMAGLQSHLSSAPAPDAVTIQVETLDDAATGAWDLMLIDVEGYEEKVLRGGRKLLADTTRRPRMIMIEVHPYAWPDSGSSSASLLAELRNHGYAVKTLTGEEVTSIASYGHIVATIE